MAIDLNGSSVAGQNYVTSYREDDPAIRIVSSSALVGNGSTSVNTDNIQHIHIALAQGGAGADDWVIAAMPAGIIVSLTLGGPAIAVPSTLSAYTNASLYLRSDGRTMPDVQWQNALKSIFFFTDESSTSTREIVVAARNSFGTWEGNLVTSQINVSATNDAPVSAAYTGEAIEAGGVNNTTPGANATGQLLTNHSDPDSTGPLSVSAVTYKGASAAAGSNLKGAYGTLTLQSTGYYTYVVDNNNAVVQGLRNETSSVTDTFSFTVRDSEGATSTSTLTITVKGKDDAPFDVAVGRHFNGTASSVVADPTPLGVSRDFAFELRVSPTNAIVLKPASLTGVAGTSGQEFAVTPLQGQFTWGSSDHAGVGLSVGTNGISVYQHTTDLLSPLLTWSGAVNANTHVAVVFNDNRPSLYVNGTLVATGLQTNKLVHPPTGVGGNNWGYFDGGISDFVVWNEALSAEAVAVRSVDPSLPESATPALTLLQVRIPENAAEGTVVTTVRARDVDSSEVLTYSLTNDAQGRFQIDVTTGVVSVAPGAVFDHETAHELTLTAKVTDLANQSVLHNFTVTVGNVNEAPMLANDAAVASRGLLTLMVDQSHGLWWLDGLGGQRSFIATANEPIGALARTAAGLYFAVSTNTLYRLDPATGHCVAIGDLNASGSLQMTGLTAAPDGHLYGVNNTDNLFRINASTGAATSLVSMNSSVSSNGDVVHVNGVLYWTTVFGDLMRYDLSTGQHSVAMHGLPTHGGLSSLPSLIANGNDTLYAVDDNAGKVYRIDLDDQSFTAMDTLLPTHTAAQTLVDGTETASSGNVFANDPAAEAGDVTLVTHVYSQSPGGTAGSAGDTINGAYGTLQLQANGNYVYEVNASNTAVQALKSPNETLEDRFTYSVTDSAGLTATAQLVVTVRGLNHAPELNSEFVSAVEASGVHNSTLGLNPGGNVLHNDTDPDTGDILQVNHVAYKGSALSLGVQQTLSYGMFRMDANGSYSYEVNQTHPAVEALRTSQDTLTETIAYRVIDSRGAVQTAHLMIRIEGRDDAPVAVAQTAIAVEAGGVHNATPGTNPTGHVIDAATDVDDAPHNVRVSQARTQVNLIRNGSFEQTSFAGSEGLVLTSIPDWTNPADFVKHANGDTASDGRVWIDLDAWTAIDSLKQTNIGTQSGKTYELQFDLSPRAGAVGTTVQVYWNEQFVGNAYVNGDGWTTATFQVTAVGNDSLRLAELASENDTAGPRIDNVRLYQTGVDQTLQGQYGTLTLNADGYYHYDVDQSNAQVQALRRAEDTLQESFSYTLTDAAGLSSTATLAVTVLGKNDAPELIPLGRNFNGNSASLITGAPLPASRDFSFALSVSPVETITLHAQSLSGVAGTSGQHYALSPLQGQAIWGSTDHAGLGLSIGSNGISVYQHTSNLLSSLLTWSGTVGPNTQVSVNVIDNRPVLYVNGQLVATGLQSTKLLHPPTEVGGINWGYFKGSIYDVQVWSAPLPWNDGETSPGDATLLYSAATLSVNENSPAGTVVTELRASDIDTGDTLTYSLLEDGGGRFAITAATGVVSVAPGAVLDREAMGSFTLKARVTDAAGLFREVSFTVQVADVNEAPTGVNAEAVMNEDNQVRFSASRAEDIVVGGVAVPAVRVDSLPAGGSLTLDGQPVTVGQILAATDAVRLTFKPALFDAWAQSLSDPDSGDRVQAVRIGTQPSAEHGRLLFDGEPIGVEDVVILLADIGKLSFEPALNYNGDVSFTYQAIDSRGMLQQGPASTFTIHVLPVNDTPVIAPTLNNDVREGVATHLSGLSVSDVDAGTGEMSISLRVDEGTLLATSHAAVTVEGSGSGQLNLRGTREALNAFLADSQGVQYLAVHHEPPTFSATTERLSPEGVEDPVVRATFTTTGGWYTSSGAEGITVAGNETQTLTLEGLASKVGPYITGGGVVREVPIPQARLTMVVNDQGNSGSDPGLTGSDTNEQDVRVIGLSIIPAGLPLNAAEVDTSNTGNAAGAEPTGSVSVQTVAGVTVGASLVIGLGIVDKIKSLANAGTAEEAAATATWIAQELGEDLHRLRGDVRHAWKEFIKWVYPDPPYVPPGEPVPPIVPPPTAPIPWPLLPGVLFALSIISKVIAGSNNDGAPLPPQVNQRPDVIAPDTLTGQEDHTLRISGVSFSDADAGDGSVEVTFELPPDHGVLRATATQQVQVLGDGSDTLKLLGTLTAINAFVAATPGVQFQPAADVNGPIDLTITINDLGNTGTDPGTSGDATSEEKSIVVTLDLTPVSDAPEGHDGRLAIEYQSSHVITEAMLGFSDVDQDSFVGIQITELPASGELMLDGQPVLLNAVVNAEDLQNNRLVFVDGSDPSGSSAAPRMGFRVLDNGSTAGDGQTVAAHASYLSFDVQYPPTLTVQTGAVAFNESDGQPLHFVTATLSDRTDPPHAIESVLIDTGTLAYGDRWGFDPAWLASISTQGQLPFARLEQGHGSTVISFIDGATPSFVQQMLDALVFEVQAPNATEGTRNFHVTVIDTGGRNSETVSIEVNVVSVLGDAMRTLDSAHADLLQSFEQAVSGADESKLRENVLAWFEARVSLAEAMWSTLALAPVQDGIHSFGPSIREAFYALTLDVSDLAAALDQDIQFPTLPPLLQAAGQGTQVDMRQADMPEWLSRVAQAQVQGIQAIYAELKSMSNPIGTESAVSGEDTVFAYDLGLATALIQGLSRLGIEPVITSVTGDPATALAQSGSAWVQTADGHVWLRADQHRQLALQMETARLDQLNGAIKPIERIVLALLGGASSEDGLLRCGSELLDLLHTVGVSTNDVISLQPTDDAVALLMQPGRIGLSADGTLLMSPLTQQQLMQSLTEVARAEISVTSPLQQLHKHLGTLIASDGMLTLDADTVHSITQSDLAVRLSNSASDIGRFGTAVVHPTNGTWQVTPATLAGWQQQLQVMTELSNPVAPYSVAHGDVLQLQAQLGAPGQESLYGRPFVNLALSPLLGNLLAAQGIDVHQAVGYSSAERDLLVAPRVQAEPRLALSIEAGRVLVPAPVALQLSHALERSLHNTGLQLNELPPINEPEVSNAPDSLTLQLSQALHAQALEQLLKQTDRKPTGEVMLLWRAVAQALAPALGFATEVSIPAGEEPAVPGIALHVTARRWVSELRELGLDVRLVDAADVAGTTPAGIWHVAADAQGRALMTSSAHAAMTQTLLIQSHANRAALAEGLVDLLTRTDVEQALSVIDSNGQLRKLTAEGAAQMGLALVPLSVVEALAALGIALPTTLLRSATASEVTDVARLGTEPDTMLVDPERSLALVSRDTLMRLAQDAVIQRIAADEARYTLDPESVPAGSSPRALALNTAGMADALQALDNASVQTDGLVRITASAAQLLRAGLAVNELNDIAGGASAWHAVLNTATMAVLSDPAQPGTLLMSQATLDHLVELASLNLDVVAAVQGGRAVPSSSDLADAWQLHETISDGFRITTEGTVFIENATLLLDTLSHFGVDYTVVGQVDDGLSDSLDALARSTTHGVVTVGDGTEVRVSQATWQNWMSAVEQAVRAQGGAALLDRWTPEGTQVPQATTDWRATTEHVANHDTLLDFINAASLDASFTAGAHHGLWSWPANGPTSSLTAWQALVGSAFTLVDVGVIDPLTTAGQDALNSAPYVIGHDADGRFWVGDHMHHVLMGTLNQRLVESRETLRAQALESLVDHPVVDGLVRWSDGALVHTLQRLGLLDADTLRLHDVPGAPSLTFIDANTVALDASTRDAVIVRLGEMALTTDTQKQAAEQWLDAVTNAIQALDIGAGQLISVPLDDLYLGSPGLKGFTVKTYPAADSLARSQADIGTILVASDGSMHMQPQTLLMLHAQLKGLTQAQTIFEVSGAVDFPHLAQVLTALSLAADQPAATSASFGSSDIRWDQSLADWHAISPAQLQMLHGILDQDLMVYLKNQGIPLTVLDDTMLMAAAQSGLIHRPFTVISDLQGQLLMSSQTLAQLGHHLVKQLKQTTGLDWTEVFDTRSGTTNALASLFDSNDNGGGVEKRSLQQNSNVNYEQDRQDTIKVFNQLLRTEPALADNSTLVLLGKNFTSAALDILMVKLADYGLPHTVVEQVAATNGTVLDGQYAVQGDQLLTTKATALELVKVADLLLRTLQIEQQRELIDQLTEQTYAGAPNLPFVQLANTTALMDALSLRNIPAITVKDVNGTLHTVAFEELMKVRPDPERNVNATVSLIDLQGQPFNASANETDAAWQSLSDGETYGVKANGDPFISMSLRNELLEQALSGTTASKALIAQHLLTGLNNATLENGMWVVESYGLVSLLKDLGIPTLEANGTSGLATTDAILSLGDNRFGMSSTTLEQISKKVEQRSLHSSALNQQLLTMLDDGQAIYNAADWLHSQTETQLASFLARSSGVIEGKLVITVTMSDALALALQQAEAISASPDPIGTTQSDYNALYELGEVRRGVSGVTGSQVLVMTTETWAQIRAQWEAAQPAPGQGVVLLDNDVLALLEDAGITPIKATQLLVNGTATNEFNSFSDFSKALNQSVNGTLFIDAQDRVWTTVDTHRALELPAQAAANAADWPLLTQDPASVAADLERYQALMPLFNGDQTAVAPAGDASGWKGYSLTATEVALLQEIGITLNSPPTPLSSLSQLTFAPAYTTQADDAGKQWIDARTYQLVSELVQGRGHALIASMFQNTWERMSVVDADGNTQVWWRSTAADGGLFEQSLSLTGLTLSHRTDLNGSDPVLDLLDDSAAYARDPLGRVFVSEATHTAMQSALERVTLQAESAYLTQSFAALNRFEVSQGLELVRVTAAELQLAIAKLSNVVINFGTVDLLNLTPDQLKLLQSSTVNVLNDGQSFYLTRAAANSLAEAVANAIPELKDAELALPAGPTVVQVRGALALDFMQDRLGMELRSLTDAQGLPVSTANVSAASLTHTQREWLDSHPDAVVRDRDGHLLMSAKTFENMSQSAARQLAETDGQIVEQLVGALSSAETSNVTAGGASGTVVTLDGPAESWGDLLRSLRTPLSTQSLAINGTTDYALLLSGNQLLGIDAQGNLVMTAATRDALLPELKTIGMRTEIIAAAGPGLINPLPDIEPFTNAVSNHPASSYYETAVGATGWARWYGVATGARAVITADLYIDGQYGQRYDALLTNYLNERVQMAELYEMKNPPLALQLLAYFDNIYAMTPRSATLFPQIDDGEQMAAHGQNVRNVRMSRMIMDSGVGAADFKEALALFDNVYRPALQSKTAALDVLRDLGTDPGNKALTDKFTEHVDAFADSLRVLLNDAEKIATAVDRLATGPRVDRLPTGAQVKNAGEKIVDDFKALSDSFYLDPTDRQTLKDGLDSINTQARRLLSDVIYGSEQIISAQDIRAQLRAQVIQGVGQEVQENDKVNELSRALQQQRLVASVGRIFLQVPAQAVDAALQFKKAGSLLGDSPEADALSNQYKWAGIATASAASASFFSALQVPAFSGLGWYYDRTAFNWGFFWKNFINTNILTPSVASPAVYYDHGTDVSLRNLVKDLLTQSIMRKEGDLLLTPKNILLGITYFLANISGIASGVSQSIQGVNTPSPLGTYLAVGSSRVDLQACKLEYSIVSPK